LIHHERVKFPVIVAIACLACKAFAAELVRVEENDLPRVPATEPANAAATFQVRDGFRLELAANEPLVVSPVAMAFDENNRLFVIEMRDYSERRDERLGRVKLLEDRDGDGRFEHATIFAENLPWPTAVICYDGGVFVGASPDILFLKDTNHDGRADVRKVVFSGFGAIAPRLNVQQLLNSFTWGIDNRIHGALGGNPGTITNRMRPGSRPLELRGRDFSFDPRTFDLRAESGGGQWGMSFDDDGNKFICNNSRHIAVEMYDDRYSGRNRHYSMPSPDVDIAVDGPAAEVFRISPDEPWRVLRTRWRVAGLVPGPVEGGGRPSGYFTGAAAVTIYRGDAFPEEFRGDAFVADCGSNLIHRKKIRRSGLKFVAERAADERRREFLASRDNWFRPVAMANGPDGALYVADMYREVVEHPWSLPPELKSRIDLNSGSDRGRIYRVVPETFARRSPVRLGSASVPDLIQTLAHPNGWHRDTAARLLVERGDAQAISLLRDTLQGSASALARVHALHLLDSLAALQTVEVRRAARDSNVTVRVQAVRVAADRSQRATNEVARAAWRAVIENLGSDPDIRVRFQFALVESDPIALTRVVELDVEEPWIRAAVLNGLGGGAADVFASLVGSREFGEKRGAAEFLREAARIAGASGTRQRVALGLQLAARSPEPMALAAAFATGLEQRGMSLATIDAKAAAQFAQIARARLADASLPEARRIEAVELLASHAPDAEPALVAVFQTSTPAAVQSAAVAALIRARPAAATNVFTHWTQLAPGARTRAVALFAGKSTTAIALLNAVERGTVQRAEVPASDVQRLINHSHAAVREKAKGLFPPAVSARRDVMEKYRPSLDLAGDVQRGRVIYLQRCASCHRSGTDGYAVGPDLVTVASAGKEKLLASIIDPNAEVAAASVAYAVETKGGDSYLGVLAGDNPLAVLLKLPNGESARVLREQVLSIRASGQSLMPEGIEEGMTPQEMADLLEFVVRSAPAP
jgi:putative membrane-bound dehydrogenase-like protein